MMIITDNGTLTKLIPNVVAEVDNEPTLFEKMRPQLEIAEQWVKNTLTGDSLLPLIASNPDRKEWTFTATAIACEAFYKTVPSIDLVLTPNGFGVVSNSNIAPASKERVERLIATVKKQRDDAIVSLLGYLRTQPDWRESRQGQWLASSLFVSPVSDTTATKVALKADDTWEAFLELREKTRPIEQAIAEKWLGQALTARLRTLLAMSDDDSSDTFTLAKTIRQLVIDELISGKRPVKNLDRCVNYIRNNGTLYPEWQSDPVAELFEDKWRFENKKNAPGYFF